MQRDRDVLFGKIAIGRGALARSDAVGLFRRAAAERRPIWEVAVEAGRLPPPAVAQILGLLDHGTLVCHGGCGARFPIADLTPRATESCRSCGGPLFIERPSGVPDDFDVHAETKRDPQIGSETANAKKGDDLHGLEEKKTIALPVRARAVPEPAAPPELEDDTADAPPEPHFATFAVAGYEVLGPIGRGGMGSVYRARHAALGRIVALKLLETEDQDQRARFQREVRAIAKLDHPNIVKVYAAGEVKDEGPHQGKPFFAMDLVEGRDLLTWSRERPRSVAECALMVARVADAMEFAHSKLIIHRDLKPQNILVQARDDAPRICDFGLAQVRADGHQLTRTGDVMGTPQYMPPEQALGDRKKIGPPTDTYALGALFYELLCGRPPFVASRLHALIAMVVRDKPKPPSALAPERGIPPAVDALVLRALEKEPVKRFHTMGELAAALRAVAGRAS